MKKVLIIEDNKTIQLIEKTRIEEDLHLEVETCETLEDSIALLKNNSYLAILADLTLPDATGTQVVDGISRFNTPTIVFTGTIDSDLRRRLLKMKILDYVIKDNPGSLDYVLRLIQFIVNNQNTAIMIVDDSKTARYDLAYAIKRIPVEIFQAKDGEEALEILEVNPHIRLILTDQEMPKMGGIKLLQKIRRKHSINELVVIGTSGSNDKSDLTIDFLKSGGNDFITKPIVHEELLTRVISNIEMLDYIKIAKESAVRDFLTGLYNRRYLYDAGTQLFENGKRKNFNIVACMLDIDFFKKVNDTYGHYAGDLALKEVSSILEKSLRGTDIVSRFGGEEFCIILSNSSLDDAHMVMEKIRKGIEALTIEYNEITFKVTISIGMTQTLGHTLSDMISIADTALYKAKESGRNCIVIE